MEINELVAFITCSCGARFQVLNQAGNDWDEAGTVQAQREACAFCPNRPEEAQ